MTVYASMLVNAFTFFSLQTIKPGANQKRLWFHRTIVYSYLNCGIEDVVASCRYVSIALGSVKYQEKLFVAASGGSREIPAMFLTFSAISSFYFGSS